MGVAQFLQFLGEITVQSNPAFQFSPCGIGGELGAVELCQLRSAIYPSRTFHRAKILKISELRKFSKTEIHIIIIIYSDFDSRSIRL